MNQQIDLSYSTGNGHSSQGSRVPPTPPSNGKDRKLLPVYRLAEQHCANWCRGGTCVGVGFDICAQRYCRITKEGGPCLLALGQRCPYFEKSVLPMETRGEKDWPTVVQGAAFREAARIYHLTFPETVAVQPTTRKCPDCGKHRIGPRKRCCVECRIRRRRASDTTKKRKWRNKGGHCPPVKENGSSLGADSRGANSKPAIIYQAHPILSPKLYYVAGGAS